MDLNYFSQKLLMGNMYQKNISEYQLIVLKAKITVEIIILINYMQ